MTEGYEVIYADPPWRYSFSRSKSRRVENQYETMSMSELRDCPVPVADDAVLFLWATAPKLREALDVMKWWGFEYKTNAVWDKGRIGMGYWFRGQHELLLVGVRGKYSPPQAKVRIPSVISSRREQHSKKPDLVASYIRRCFPEAKRIELFARGPREGWEVWGYEAETTDPS